MRSLQERVLVCAAQRPENGVLMVVCCWQLVISALVFNVGRPFRREIWSNPWLLTSLLGLMAFDLYILWSPGARPIGVYCTSKGRYLSVH